MKTRFAEWLRYVHEVGLLNLSQRDCFGLWRWRLTILTVEYRSDCTRRLLSPFARHNRESTAATTVHYTNPTKSLKDSPFHAGTALGEAISEATGSKTHRRVGKCIETHLSMLTLVCDSCNRSVHGHGLPIAIKHFFNSGPRRPRWNQEGPESKL